MITNITDPLRKIQAFQNVKQRYFKASIGAVLTPVSLYHSRLHLLSFRHTYFEYKSKKSKCNSHWSKRHNVWSAKYRVIHNSLRDFRPLGYSSRDGHAEGEHVNRGADTPSFCPTLRVLDMSTLGDAADVNLANSKTHNAFLFPVHHMFRHVCPLAVKPASTPRCPVHKKKLGEILYLLICSFLLCLSWLSRSRVRNFRRDL
jgi:hypothetical protein